MPLQVLQWSIATSKVHSLGASARLFLSCKRMENIGSEIPLRRSQPSRSAQRGLTYTLSLRGIWAQCIVFQEYVFFVEARGLVSNAPTWNKQSSELFTHSLAELARVLGRGVLRIITRMSFRLLG